MCELIFSVERVFEGGSVSLFFSWDVFVGFGNCFG